MHLGGWLAFVFLKNDKDWTVLTVIADFTVLLWFKCSVTVEETFLFKPKLWKKTGTIWLKDTFCKLSGGKKEHRFARGSELQLQLWQIFFLTDFMSN